MTAKTPLRPRRALGLAAACAGAAMAALAASAAWWLQASTDMWFFLPTGRYICESGIPYENPFAAEEGLRIVVQQWLWDVGCWKLYELGGMDALAAFAAALSALVALALVALVRGFGPSGRSGPSPCDVLVAGCVLTLGGLFTWSSAQRPHLVTMACLCAVLGVCEKVRRGADRRLLAALPCMMCLHMQLHMSMAPLDIAACAAFCLPSSPAEARALLTAEGRRAAARRAAPYAVACAAMAAAMPLNPYGADGALYTLRSLGAASYRNAISEMKPLVECFGATPRLAYELAALSLAAVAPVALAARRGRIRPDLAALTVAALASTFLHARGGWIPLVVGSASWGWALERPAREEGCHPAFLALLGAGSLALICAAAGPSALARAQGTYEADADPLIDEAGEGATIACTRWIDFNYLEFRGLKVLVDARPEIWEPGISGAGEHLNEEYFDAISKGDALGLDEASFMAYVRRTGSGYVLSCKEGNGQNPADDAAVRAFAGLELVAETQGYALYRVV